MAFCLTSLPAVSSADYEEHLGPQFLQSCAPLRYSESHVS